MNKLLEFLGKLDIIKLGIAFVVVISLGEIVWALIHSEIPESNREILVHTLGIIEGILAAIASFYWGASVNNKKEGLPPSE